MKAKICITCGLEYYRPRCYSNAKWEGRKYCSKKCMFTDEWKAKKSELLKGKPGLKKGKPGLRNEKNPRWKGNSALYGTKHDWLSNNYEKVMCEHCGDNKKKLTWALKKGCEHSRSRDNYLVLCHACHSKYDDISGQMKKIWQERRGVTEGEIYVN